MTRDREVWVYGGYEPVRDTRTGAIVALLPLAGTYPPVPRGLARVPGRCTHCGELLDSGGFCTPYSEDRRG
jgi:hypothetical protein